MAGKLMAFGLIMMGLGLTMTIIGAIVGIPIMVWGVLILRRIEREKIEDIRAKEQAVAMERQTRVLEQLVQQNKKNPEVQQNNKNVGQEGPLRHELTWK